MGKRSEPCQRRYRWANKHTKRFSTSCIIRELQTKTKMTHGLDGPNPKQWGHHYTGEDLDQQEFFRAGGNAK